MKPGEVIKTANVAYSEILALSSIWVDVKMIDFKIVTNCLAYNFIAVHLLLSVFIVLFGNRIDGMLFAYLYNEFFKFVSVRSISSIHTLIIM